MIFLLLLFNQSAHAFTHEDEVHLAAHTGASYALQTVFYGFNNRVLKFNKPISEAVAAIETLGIGFLYKFGETADASSTEKAMLENTLGVGLAVGTHIVFQF